MNLTIDKLDLHLSLKEREKRKKGRRKERRGGGRHGKRRGGKGREERKWTENLKLSRKPHIPSFWADDKDVHQTLNDNCILPLRLNGPLDICKD